MALAPADNPTIALAVIVENAGWGAGSAAPIARRAFDYMLLGQYPSEEDMAAVQKGQAGAPIGKPRRAADVLAQFNSAANMAAAPSAQPASAAPPASPASVAKTASPASADAKAAEAASVVKVVGNKPADKPVSKPRQPKPGKPPLASAPASAAP